MNLKYKTLPVLLLHMSNKNSVVCVLYRAIDNLRTELRIIQSAVTLLSAPLHWQLIVPKDCYVGKITQNCLKEFSGEKKSFSCIRETEKDLNNNVRHRHLLLFTSCSELFSFSPKFKHVI